MKVLKNLAINIAIEIGDCAVRSFGYCLGVGLFLLVVTVLL